MRICSFTFEELSSPSENPYSKRKNAKYVGQKSPDASRIYKEMSKEEPRYVKHGRKSVKI
jgi:dCTP deaminase